jgi:RsiW-degrading membrane proteinase PrsW (M82 family)
VTTEDLTDRIAAARGGPAGFPAPGGPTAPDAAPGGPVAPDGAPGDPGGDAGLSGEVSTDDLTDAVHGRAHGPPRSEPSAPVVPTPAGATMVRSLLQPAFWLLLTLLVIGGARLYAMVGDAFDLYPVATVTAAALFTLYAVPFVLVLRSIDFLEREPLLLVAAAMAWGGLVATTTAIPGDTAVRDILAKLGSPAFATAWGPAIAGPALEEVLKTLGVVVVVMIARKQVNSIVDGAVYGAFVGLGFQVVEDFLYAVNAVAIDGRGDDASPVVATFFLRGFLGGLWSHTLFSALAGAGVAYFVVRRGNRSRARRVAVAVLGVGGAWLCHFVWNSPWLSDGLGGGLPGVVGALLLKGVPALAMIVLLVRAASRGEADFYLHELVSLGDPRIITAGEMDVLRTGRRRLAARRYAFARCGRPGSTAVRRLQVAQARLAVELSRQGERVEPLRAAVLSCRRQLVSYGHPEAVGPPTGTRPWGAVAITVCFGAVVVAAVAFAILALGGQ